MNALIPPGDTWTLWALVMSGTAASIWLEQRFRWAARLSGPVLALLIAMILTNTRVMPARAPAYDFVGDYLVPLAIPLLLFRANIVRIVRSTGRLFLAFHLSSVGTLAGTVLAVLALRGWIGPPDLEHAAGMMAASYIGGSVNFMAVKTSYSVAPEVSDPLIVADNFVMAAMFAALLGLASAAWCRRLFARSALAAPEGAAADANAEGAGLRNLAAQHWQAKAISLLDLAKALAVAAAVVAIARLLESLLARAFGDVSHASIPVQMFQVLCTNRFVLITAVSLAPATVFHRSLSTVNGPEELGTLMLYLFLFCIGLPADLRAVLVQAPLYFVFCGIIAVVNLVVALALGRALRLPLEEMVLAVNANLGGAPSAAAMAISAGWPRLVLPGILVGIWGYVIGTPVGVLVVETIRRLSHQ